MTPSTLDAAVASDFSRARGRAFFGDIIAFLFGEDNRLLSFDAVKHSLRIGGQSYMGVRTVEVAKIVGSVDRYADFDRAFMPTQTHTAERWKSVDRAHYQSIELPPVSLYKIGDMYFVRDGHHRVSVAREQGVWFIDAEIIACETRVPLSGRLRPEDLVIVGEYADFLEKTGLDRLRPDQRIEFSIPGHYSTLLQHIETHRYFLGQERQAPVSWEEAVTSWYDTLYLPMVRIIREREVLDHFPDRTEADLYVWIMDHLYYLKEQHGPDLDPGAATDDFTRQFGLPEHNHNLGGWAKKLADGVESMLGRLGGG
jgi:hypothetical protein